MKSRASIVLMTLTALAVGCGSDANLSVVISSEHPLESVSRVRLAVFGSNENCASIMAAPESSASLPVCTENQPELDCVVTRTEISDTGTAPVLFVSEGSRFLLGVAYDSEAEYVASGCTGPFDIEAGSTTSVELLLE